MERQGKGIKQAVERVKSEVQTITNEAVSTIQDIRSLVRDILRPRPLRRRLQRELDKILRRQRE